MKVYLFALSFISLFLELALIRWIGTEIRIFAYFRNLALVSCFVGLGIGFSVKRVKPGLLFSLALLGLLALSMYPSPLLAPVSPRRISELLAFADFHVWAETGPAPSLARMGAGFALLTAAVAVLAAVFVPFGLILGRIFDASTNRLRDYSINVAGGLAGVWAFALISWLELPPWWWFVISAAALALLIRPISWKTSAGLALAAALFFLTAAPDRSLPPGTEVVWSPYQKVTVEPKVGYYRDEVPISYWMLNVNSVFYMFILDLSKEQMLRVPGAYSLADAPYYPYDLPYRFLDHAPERVLIVGAGAGNDAAAALRNGAGWVDAVEIDPAIARLGARLHPEKPYADPRVNLVIDDARSFMKRTNKRYDLISFALLDSHTLASNFTNQSLDSYVYTVESIREARALLNDRGVLAVNFEVARRPWLGDKVYDLVSRVFDQPPFVVNNRADFVMRGIGGAMFVAGDFRRINERVASDPRLKALLQGGESLARSFAGARRGVDFDAPTDDWPYLYLRTRSMPTLYSIMTAVMVALAVAAVLLLSEDRRMGPWHFFFLGAGFMLVEAHSISKAALLFGSTWMVNAVIISAALVMVLAANLATLRLRVERLRWWYAGLMGTLALSFIVPVSGLMIGGYALRGVVAGAFYALPLFFAGVVFAASLQKVRSVDTAFAANMIGAAVGGMMENASFIFGLKAVVILALILYAGSALTLDRVPLLSGVKGKLR